MSDEKLSKLKSLLADALAERWVESVARAARQAFGAGTDGTASAESLQALRDECQKASARVGDKYWHAAHGALTGLIEREAAEQRDGVIAKLRAAAG
jgi:hypothetical protein